MNGLIFDVKGLLHPPERVVAYLRYIPDGRGRRERAGIKYRKVYSLQERTELLAKKWPQYLWKDPFFSRVVQAVPVHEVKQHYSPIEKFAQLQGAVELNEQERLASEMAATLAKEAQVSTSKVGVSGSLLVGLNAARSDIDLVFYGSSAARRCHSKLRELLGTCARGFSPYAKRDLQRLYTQRDQRAAVSFATFVQHEQPKVQQGKFRGTDYFIRCIKEWDEWSEAYGDKKYLQTGPANVRATISDDSESIFTPCTYDLTDAKATGGHPPPTQIVSFRGRFCEQARTGDSILAKGILERVADRHEVSYRLVIGENPLDSLVVVGKRE
jgi:predicted nucleotidyltransferase